MTDGGWLDDSPCFFSGGYPPNPRDATEKFPTVLSGKPQGDFAVAILKLLRREFFLRCCFAKKNRAPSGTFPVFF